MTLHSILQDAAKTFPTRPMLQYEDQTWTYSEVDALSDRIAASLWQHGVRPGDRVALLFANGPEFVFSCFACFKIGAVIVPINTRFQTAEILYVLNHTEARALLGQAELCTPMLARHTEAPHLEHAWVTGEATAFAETRLYSELYQQTAEPVILPEIKEDELAALFYTSGTTAHPKGVMHTHATLTRLGENIVSVSGEEAMARTVVVLPMCHMAGFGCQFLPFLHRGGTFRLIPRFEPQTVLRALAESQATYFVAMPVHFNMLVNCPNAEKYDLSALQFCAAGGDSVPVELQNRFRALFGVELDEVCGMTEIIYSANRPPQTRRIGSIGQPFGDITLRLLDTEGNEVATGEVGEIVAHSRAMTIGYWNDPDATAEAIRNGGLHTGDLARKDEDGYYWFVGRKKDIIIRGGSNISPAEVEAVLYTHPAVYEAGVVGVPDPLWGQIVHAYVALKPGMPTTEVELHAFLAERLAAYKVPERILFLNELPKGPTGKIFRRALREQPRQEQPS